MKKLKRSILLSILLIYFVGCSCSLQNFYCYTPNTNITIKGYTWTIKIWDYKIHLNDKNVPVEFKDYCFFWDV